MSDGRVQPGWRAIVARSALDVLLLGSGFSCYAFVLILLLRPAGIGRPAAFLWCWSTASGWVLASCVAELVGRRYSPWLLASATRLRPVAGSEKAWTGTWKFLSGSLRIAALSFLAAAAVEASRYVYETGQYGAQPGLRRDWFGWEFAAASSLMVAGRVAALAHPQGFARLRRLFDWKGLAEWTGRQKWLNSAAFSFVVLLYAANYVGHAQVPWIVKANEEIRFQFLGRPFELADTLAIEATGFLIGLLATTLFNVASPIGFRRGKSSTQDALRRTMRQCGGEVHGGHFQGTFKLYRKVLGEKREWGDFEWKHVDARIERLREGGPSARLSREASFIIVEMPPDETVLTELQEVFFLHVRPVRRWLLSLMLVAAEAMTLYPIIARVFVFYLPRFKDSPSTWPIYNFLQG